MIIIASGLLISFTGPAVVRASSTPLAAFTWNHCVLCVVPGDLVFFDANWSVSPASSISSIISYTWNFGDGSPLVKTTNPLINHDYFGFPGKWVVTLTVQDAGGSTDTVNQLVLFDTVPRFTFQPKTPAVGEQVDSTRRRV
jgi:PKD repeat protein